jgi:hypothetical protein
VQQILRNFTMPSLSAQGVLSKTCERVPAVTLPLDGHLTRSKDS